MNIASVTTDNETYDVYTVPPGSVGNVLERHTGATASGGGTSNSRYYQYNHRGDVVMVTNASGALVWAQDYTAFGHVASDDAGTWGGAGARSLDTGGGVRHPSPASDGVARRSQRTAWSAWNRPFLCPDLQVAGG